MNAPTTTDYESILRNSIPLIDVRSPNEFKKGSFPSAVSLPILNDAERSQVGIRYKDQGNEAAVSLGHELVSGTTKDDRVKHWTEFVRANPKAIVTCWRGGMRSKIAQQWLVEAGFEVPRLVGGTKALRSFCLSTLEQAPLIKFVVLGGRTGSNKTSIVQSANPSIDLEGLANHRGSSFGRLREPQPTPINFENAIAAELLRLCDAETVLVEDESRTIGRLAIPKPLFDTMRQASIVVVRVALERRASLTFEHYVMDQEQEQLQSALERIKKRLGLERFKEIHRLMLRAFESGQREDHLEWIASLLSNYYDPMYDYQLKQKATRIVFQGTPDEVSEYLDHNYGVN